MLYKLHVYNFHFSTEYQEYLDWLTDVIFKVTGLGG